MTRTLALLAPLVLSGCYEKDDDTGSPTSLLWYTTCGDPVCGGYDAAAHTNPPCTTEVAETACSPEGAGCDLQDDCNTEMICATEDPKDAEGGCPISLRSAKTEVHYLGPDDARALHDAVVGMKLADWRYRTEAEGAGHHVGFIIDDLPAGTPAVRPGGDRVDLYGYTSMAVAALQVQDARIAVQEAVIAAQQTRIDALETRLASLEAAR